MGFSYTIPLVLSLLQPTVGVPRAQQEDRTVEALVPQEESTLVYFSQQHDGITYISRIVSIPFADWKLMQQQEGQEALRRAARQFRLEVRSRHGVVLNEHFTRDHRQSQSQSAEDFEDSRFRLIDQIRRSGEVRLP